MTTPLKVTIDRSVCCGYGVCAEICPEVYGLDDNGIIVLLTDTVPEGLEESAREGAAACPQFAIVVSED